MASLKPHDEGHCGKHCDGRNVSTKELIAYAKAKPGALNYGSAGNGSTLHLSAALLISEAGIEMKHVPYRGAGSLVTDLIGGGESRLRLRVAGCRADQGRHAARDCGQHPATLERIAGHTDARRVGVPKYEFDASIALVGPSGLPKPTIGAAAAAIRTAMKSPKAQTAIAGQCLTVLDIGPDAAPAFFQTELVKHQKLVSSQAQRWTEDRGGGIQRGSRPLLEHG